jgi:PAS domain S-box-containing protein
MKDSQQKYKVLLNNSVSAILFTKLDGSILDVNQTAVTMFGHKREEFIKLCQKNIIDHRDEALPRILNERVAKGTVKGELTGIRKNGKKFPIRFSSTLFLDEDGLEYSCTTIQDISERKKSEQEMALMINNTEESFVLLDVNLCIVSFNTQFQKIGKLYFGFNAKNGDYIIDYAPQAQAQELKEFYTLVLKGTKQKKELVVPTAEGNTKYFILTYTPTIADNNTVIGIFISARDITEETESQLAIKETKSELEKIMNSSLDIICTIDVEGNFVKISNASEKVWGYMPEELVGKKYTQHVHPEDLEKSKIVTLEIIAGFDQTNFQNRYIKKDGTIVPIIWSAKWDDTEKMMYCIAKDGTEKVKQEAAIIESGKLYKNLFESSPVPMFIFDFETLQIIDCNEETVLKYGYTKEEFLTFTIKDISLPEDIEKIEKAVVDETTYGQIHKKVWRHQKKNGDIMFMDVSGHLITYNDKRMSLVMLIDVTEKLKVEKQREFEKRDKEALINSTNDLIWSVNKKFKLLAANQAFVKNLEQNIGVTIKVGDDLILDNVYPKAYLEFWKCYYTRALNGESFIEEVKSPSYADQKEVWYDITFNPIYKQREVVGIACYARNITENKKIKQELIYSEEKYRLLFYSSPLPNWIFDIETSNIIDVNETAIAHYGYSKDEFLSMNLKDLRTENDFFKLQEAIDEGIKSTGVSLSGIFTHRKKNGEFIKVEISGHNISYQGKKSRIVVANDVTERENALNALKDRESKLKSAQQIAKLGYWQRNIVTETLFWSSEVYKILGIDKTIKPSFELLISAIHPEDIDAFMKERYAVISDKKEMDLEHRILLKDGSIKWVHQKGKLQQSPDGQNNLLDGTVQDITERKKIEEKLKESIQRYENVTKATDDAIWDWDFINDITYRAEGFKTSFGFDLKQLNSPDTNWKNHIHPDDEPTVTKSLFDTINSNENYWNQEYRIIKSDGNEAFVQDRAYLIRNKNNEAIRIVGALKDISESKYYHNVEILEREILELNALGNIPIEEVIGKYMLGLQKLHAGMLCSMQVVKGKLLFNLAAPSLPENFLKVIDGNKIGNNIGSCGTAAYLKKRIIVTDIPNDIRWADYKEVARDNGLKACWSNPIFNSEGKVLATFAAYYREIKAPSILEENSIERAGHILQVILEGYLKEKALIESNLRYENVTKATSDAIWDWDIVTNKVLWGETFNHIFGKINDETLSDENKVKKRLHPEEAELIFQSARAAIKSKDLNWSYEHRYLKADGDYAYVLNKVVIIRGEDGRAVRVIGAMQDITERKKSEEATRKSNERFELIGKAANDAIWEWDFVINKGWGNLAHQEMFGLTLKNSIPDRDQWKNRLHPSERENILQRFQEAVNAKSEIFYGEYQFKTENKGWISISDRTYIEYDTLGQVKRKIGSMSNITQRKQEEHRLKLMSSVITNTNDAILITEAEPFDEPGPKIIYVNEAFTKMTGYSFDEVIGKTPRILQGPKSDKNELIRLRKALNNWESCEITTINYKKNGEEFWINFMISPVADATGWFTHWIAIERDVTIRKNEELQNELIATISKVFHESIPLHETLDRALSYIIDFGGFCFTEAWLVSTDRNIINRVSSNSVTENMKLFLSDTTAVETFIGKEGIVEIAAKTKELLIWEDLPNKKDFKRGKVAEKFGLNTIIALPLLYNNDIIGVVTFGLDYSILGTAKYTSLFKSLSNYLAPEIKRKQLEQELNQLFNFAPDIITIVGLDGYFKKINPVACELLGYTIEELMAVPYTNFIHPDDRSTSDNEAQTLRVNNHTSYFENRYITKSGSIKWLAWNAVYVKEENNIYGVAKDITEKKELEDLLQKANELARIGGWEVDIQKNIVFWSDITKEIHEVETDYVPDLQSGLNFYKKGKSRSAIRRYIRRAFKTGKSWDDEFQIITSKGNERWIRVIGEVELVNGNYNRIYGSFQDIDERKKAEEKIKSSEERRKLIMNAALDAIICINKEGMITFWNPQAEQIFGWTENEVMGEALSGLIIPENYRIMHDNGMKNYLKTGKGPALNVLLQLLAIRSNGEEFPIELTVLPIKQDGKEFFCAFIRDISERKMYETQLIELNENLKRQKAELIISNHELEQFAYIASHDLQEPLRMVTSFLTLLNKKYGANFDETASTYIDFAVDGAKRMQKLILDLLEYSRVGKAYEIAEFIDLNTLIAEIKILCRKQIEEIDADIIVIEPLPLIKSHKSPLLQLFQNLISNALKYSRKDVTPTVKISFTSHADYWEFKVDDNGIGIGEEYFEKIFVIFQRLHNKDEYSGTGMGLAVTKKIVESLGGRIWLRSSVNIGSEFYFTIPKKNI